LTFTAMARSHACSCATGASVGPATRAATSSTASAPLQLGVAALDHEPLQEEEGGGSVAQGKQIGSG
jgi:hypothetical protein